MYQTSIPPILPRLIPTETDAQKRSKRLRFLKGELNRLAKIFKNETMPAVWAKLKEYEQQINDEYLRLTDGKRQRR